MRALGCAFAISAALLAGAPRAAASPAGFAPLIATAPDAAVERFAQGRASALGVYPPSRDPMAFMEELVRLAPRGDGETVASMAKAGMLTGWIEPGMEDDPASRIVGAFGAELVADRYDAAIIVAASEATLRSVMPIVTIGIGTRTPLLVVINQPSPSRIAGRLTRRGGIVTPYDIAGSIVAAIDSARAPHPRIEVEPGAEPTDVRALAARLERDVSFGPGLSKTTASFGIGCVVIGAFALRRRRWRDAGALARAGALVPLGYIAGLFVPSARWEVRSICLLVAFFTGALWPARDSRRFCGVVLSATSVLLAALTVAAALRPDAEPALSLWGDPLTSWRFFGLRNHLTAFLTGGTIVGLLLLRARTWVVAAGIVATGVVIGAPWLGANYVAILTLGFGATIAVLARARGRVEPWHVAAGAAAGVAGTVLALLADAGTPATHGGRAVSTVREGGAEAAWTIVWSRAQLNYREVADIGWAAFLGFGLAVVIVAWLFAWGARSPRPVPARAAVAGAAAASLAALFVEDSGFFTGGILGLYPWIAFASDRLDEALHPASGQAGSPP